MRYYKQGKIVAPGYRQKKTVILLSSKIHIKDVEDVKRRLVSNY